MSLLHWFCDRQNVTFFIAVAGFILSIYNLIRDALREREHYSVEVLDCRVRSNGDLMLFVFVNNHSEKPLTLVSISIDSVPCSLTSTPVLGSPGELGYRCTPDFPLCIAAHGGSYMYLTFPPVNGECIRVTLDKGLTAKIRSTRRTVNKRLALNKTGRHFSRTM